MNEVDNAVKSTDAVLESVSGDTENASTAEIGNLSEDTEGAPTEENELELLREQVKRLKEELERRERETEQAAKELSDFRELFPNTDVATLPDSIWDSVRQGNSLAAAYAIHYRRQQLKAEAVHAANQKNASLSSGYVGNGSVEYYTPDEVRAMSRTEVKANYKKIIASMKKWS